MNSIGEVQTNSETGDIPLTRAELCCYLLNPPSILPTYWSALVVKVSVFIICKYTVISVLTVQKLTGEGKKLHIFSWKRGINLTLGTLLI